MKPHHGTIAGALACLLLAACQSAPPPNVDVEALSRGTSVAALSDPCAINLQNIEESILLYYTVNHRLPETLEALKVRATGQPLELVCPVSKKPYVYTAVDLTGGDPNGRLLIAYDATPVHDGKRWAVVAAPSNPGQTLTMWLAMLDERTFKYLESVTNAHVAQLRPARQ